MNRKHREDWEQQQIDREVFRSHLLMVLRNSLETRQEVDADRWFRMKEREYAVYLRQQAHRLCSQLDSIRQSVALQDDLPQIVERQFVLVTGLSEQVHEQGEKVQAQHERVGALWCRIERLLPPKPAA